MANWKDINSASATIRKHVDDLEISKDGKAALEAVMICNFAAGRPDEGALVMQALGKSKEVRDNAELVDTLKGVKEVLTELRGPVKTDGPTEDVEAFIKAEIAKGIKSHLDGGK